MDISGLIPVNKPRGMTSKDVSRLLTRRFGKLKIGHVGTLDPDADGVLTVLIGRGTKLQDYLLCMPKAYQFELTLGVSTDSLDATGKITAEKPWQNIGERDIELRTKEFLGEIVQIPPLYSAVKYQGKELYKYARSGKSEQEIPLSELQRKVTIYSLTIDHFNLPKIVMTAHCSKGTYIRTLAADIADAVGTVGHVSRLTRILSSGFSITECLSLDQVEDSSKSLLELIIPMDSLDIGLPTWKPSDMVLLQRLIDGQKVVMTKESFPISGMTPRFDVLAKASDGRSVGIIQVESLVLESQDVESHNSMPNEGKYVKLHMKRGL